MPFILHLAPYVRSRTEKWREGVHIPAMETLPLPSLRPGAQSGLAPEFVTGEEPRKMDIAGWHASLSIARSEEEVVLLLREFLAEWPEPDLQDLPEKCRPGHLRNGVDVFLWAYTLTSSYCVRFGTDREEGLLADMSNVFARASRQLAMLASKRQRDRLAPPIAP
jgi:hypothetical protein